MLSFSRKGDFNLVLKVSAVNKLQRSSLKVSSSRGNRAIVQTRKTLANANKNQRLQAEVLF